MQQDTSEALIRDPESEQITKRDTVKDLNRWTVSPFTNVPDWKIEALGRSRVMTFELLALSAGLGIGNMHTIGYGAILASERIVIERVDKVIEQFLDVTHMWHILEVRSLQLSEVYTMHTREYPRVTISRKEKKSNTLALLAVGVELPSGKVVVENEGDMRFYSDIHQLGYRYLSDPRIIIQTHER